MGYKRDKIHKFLKEIEEDSQAKGRSGLNLLGKWYKQLKEVFSIARGQKFNHDLMKCVVKYIDLIVINVSMIPTKKQLTYSKNYFGKLGALIQKDQKAAFIYDVSEKVLEIVVELDGHSWVMSKELLKMYFKTIKDTTVELRNYTMRQLPDIWMFKLTDSIGAYSDYDMQVLIIEVIIHLYGKDHLNSKIRELIPESQEISNQFIQIDPNYFDHDVRIFLNKLNKNSKNLFSIVCDNIKLGDYFCITPLENMDGLWVDFNMTNRVISWYCGIRTFDIAEDNKSKAFELITILAEDIDSYIVSSSSTGDDIIIKFELKTHPLNVHEKYKFIIKNTFKCMFMLKNSDDTRKLIRQVLPKVFGRKPLDEGSSDVVDCNLRSPMSNQMLDRSIYGIDASEKSSIFWELSRTINPSSDSYEAISELSGSQHSRKSSSREVHLSVIHSQSNAISSVKKSCSTNSSSVFRKASQMKHTLKAIIEEPSILHPDSQRNDQIESLQNGSEVFYTAAEDFQVSLELNSLDVNICDDVILLSQENERENQGMSQPRKLRVLMPHQEHNIPPPITSGTANSEEIVRKMPSSVEFAAIMNSRKASAPTEPDLVLKNRQKVSEPKVDFDMVKVSQTIEECVLNQKDDGSDNNLSDVPDIQTLNNKKGGQIDNELGRYDANSVICLYSSESEVGINSQKTKTKLQKLNSFLSEKNVSSSEEEKFVTQLNKEPIRVLGKIRRRNGKIKQTKKRKQNKAKIERIAERSRSIAKLSSASSELIEHTSMVTRQAVNKIKTPKGSIEKEIAGRDNTMKALNVEEKPIKPENKLVQRIDSFSDVSIIDFDSSAVTMKTKTFVDQLLEDLDKISCDVLEKPNCSNEFDKLRNESVKETSVENTVVESPIIKGTSEKVSGTASDTESYAGTKIIIHSNVTVVEALNERPLEQILRSPPLPVTEENIPNNPDINPEDVILATPSEESSNVICRSKTKKSKMLDFSKSVSINKSIAEGGVAIQKSEAGMKRDIETGTFDHLQQEQVDNRSEMNIAGSHAIENVIDMKNIPNNPDINPKDVILAKPSEESSNMIRPSKTKKSKMVDFPKSVSINKSIAEDGVAVKKSEAGMKSAEESGSFDHLQQEHVDNRSEMNIAGSHAIGNVVVDTKTDLNRAPTQIKDQKDALNCDFKEMNETTARYNHKNTKSSPRSEQIRNEDEIDVILGEADGINYHQQQESLDVGDIPKIGKTNESGRSPASAQDKKIQNLADIIVHKEANDSGLLRSLTKEAQIKDSLKDDIIKIVKTTNDIEKPKVADVVQQTEETGTMEKQMDMEEDMDNKTEYTNSSVLSRKRRRKLLDESITWHDVPQSSEKPNTPRTSEKSIKNDVKKNDFIFGPKTTVSCLKDKNRKGLTLVMSQQSQEDEFAFSSNARISPIVELEDSKCKKIGFQMRSEKKVRFEKYRENKENTLARHEVYADRGSKRYPSENRHHSRLSHSKDIKPSSGLRPFQELMEEFSLKHAEEYTRNKKRSYSRKERIPNKTTSRRQPRKKSLDIVLRGERESSPPVLPKKRRKTQEINENGNITPVEFDVASTGIPPIRCMLDEENNALIHDHRNEHDSYVPEILEAPEWVANAVHGRNRMELRSSDYQGKYLLMFFYPSDFGHIVAAPKELEDFSAIIDTFKSLKVEVIGCCTNDINVHMELLAKKPNILIPLVADSASVISMAFRVYVTKWGYNMRAAIFIDPKGTILWRVCLHDVTRTVSVDQLLSLVRSHVC